MKKSPFFDKVYLRRVAVYTMMILLALGILIYVGFHMSGDFVHDAETMYARGELFPKTIECEGYILRNEIPLGTSGTSGACLVPLIPDGGRVRAGAAVAEVYSEASPGTTSQIAYLREEAEFYEKYSAAGTTLGDTGSTEQGISDAVIAMRRAAEAGNISDALSYKSSLFLNIRTLGIMTGRISDFSAKADSLRAEINNLKSSLGPAIQTVTSDKTGYYYSETDGYEEIFSSENIDNLTYSKIMDMINSSNLPVSQDVSTSLGKIVRDFKWYVACHMSATEAAKLADGGTYEVTLKNNIKKPITMDFYKSLTSGADAVVLLECRRVPDGYDFSRMQNVSVTVSEFEGYKIPVSAIRVVDGEEGVFILDETVVDFRRVNIFEEDDGYYYCALSDVGDTEDEADESAVETSAADEENSARPPYLGENDLIFVNGTGLRVGMTYQPGK